MVFGSRPVARADQCSVRLWLLFNAESAGQWADGRRSQRKLEGLGGFGRQMLRRQMLVYTQFPRQAHLNLWCYISRLRSELTMTHLNLYT